MDTIGPLRKEISVFTEIHSMVTSATTPITPIHEETIETSRAVIINIVNGLPNVFLKLNIKVSPETMVNLLMATRRKYVKKHDSNSAQDRLRPYFAPETTIEVTLPVPTT